MMIAIITMMAHYVIPHHEHGSKVCFENVECSDATDPSSSEDHHPCCMDNQEVLRSVNDQDQICIHGAYCEFHFPPVLLFIGDFFSLTDDNRVIVYKPYLNLYQSVDLLSANALRGPPQA